MRNLKVLLVCGILLAGLASTAEAQSSWDGRGYYLNVNFGGQAQDEEFTDVSTFDIYGEQGVVASGQSIGGGPFFEIAGGRRVWQNFGLGLGYTAIQTKRDSAVSLRVPHPIVRNQPRELSAPAGELEHSESAVHVQIVWIMPITNEFKLMFMGGPSFFSVRQEVATVSPQDLVDAAPFTSVTINNVTRREVKDSPVGFNIGVDGTYHLTSRYGVRIGVGGFLRYTGAGAGFATASGDGSVRAGGPQAGIGLRLRY